MSSWSTRQRPIPADRVLKDLRDSGPDDPQTGLRLLSPGHQMGWELPAPIHPLTGGESAQILRHAISRGWAAARCLGMTTLSCDLETA